MADRYAKSIEQLARAEAVIPLGSQTFSKSRRTFPPGLAPLFADRASGGRRNGGTSSPSRHRSDRRA